jgi:hypothetical protein
MEARAGDHLIAPFQCDLCHFRNVYHRNPMSGDFVDDEVMEFMRQAITDSVWSHEHTMAK